MYTKYKYCNDTKNNSDDDHEVSMSYINYHQISSYIISSSCCAASTDLPDPHLLPVSIIHCFRKVFQATSCISTEFLYIGSSFACPCEGVHRSTSLMSLSL